VISVISLDGKKISRARKKFQSAGEGKWIGAKVGNILYSSAYCN